MIDVRRLASLRLGRRAAAPDADPPLHDEVVVAIADVVPAGEVLHLLDLPTRDRLVHRSRDRTASAHALLRLLLTELTGTPPHEHAFDRWCGACGGPHGKPVLRHPDLHAGLASTERLVIAAVTAAGAVGVDVETVAHTDFADFASTALAPGEHAECLDDRARAWTRKEAVLKAIGTGLTLDPRRIDVRASLVPWPQAVRVQDVAVGPGHAAAVAVVGHGRPLISLRPSSLPG